MNNKSIVVASLATKESIEIASELSAFGMTAVVRRDIPEIPQSTDAVIIDNSTGEMVECVNKISRSFGRSAKIFVITGGESEVFEKNGVLYIPPNMSAKNIAGIVDFCLNPIRQLDHVIKKMLFDLGFMSHFRGHRYIIDAVKIIVDAPEKAYNMSKLVYEPVGEMHGYDWHAIERSIRKAIEVAYDRDNNGKFVEFFGCLDHKPTNVEFISTCVEKILMKF